MNGGLGCRLGVFEDGLVAVVLATARRRIACAGRTPRQAAGGGSGCGVAVALLYRWVVAALPGVGSA